LELLQQKNIKDFEKLIKPPLAVVCHDAGSANLIVHWLKSYQNDMQVCMEGPAKDIWRKFFPTVALLSITDVVKGANTLLSGTGWGELEYYARDDAKKKGVYNIAVIDHWTAYKERFIRNNIKILPDVIIVSDKFARNQADKIFPDIQILELDNSYLHYESRLISSYRVEPINRPPKRILALMEPFRNDKFNGDLLEFASLGYLIDNLNRITDSEEIEICLRLHPSEKRNKYDCFLRENIKISNNLSLGEDLAWADLVVGMQSYAMAIAVHAGIPTISIFPPGSYKCILPYPEIKHLRDL
jgi:hypothetical protein